MSKRPIRTLVVKSGFVLNGLISRSRRMQRRRNERLDHAMLAIVAIIAAAVLNRPHVEGGSSSSEDSSDEEERLEAEAKERARQREHTVFQSLPRLHKHFFPPAVDVALMRSIVQHNPFNTARGRNVWRTITSELLFGYPVEAYKDRMLYLMDVYYPQHYQGLAQIPNVPPFLKEMGELVSAARALRDEEEGVVLPRRKRQRLSYDDANVPAALRSTNATVVAPAPQAIRLAHNISSAHVAPASDTINTIQSTSQAQIGATTLSTTGFSQTYRPIAPATSQRDSRAQRTARSTVQNAISSAVPAAFVSATPNPNPEKLLRLRKQEADNEARRLELKSRRMALKAARRHDRSEREAASKLLSMINSHFTKIVDNFDK